ncbi:hypothetical protein [Actinoplanes sp. M2I2]|uniref:hypothetical protein n=1 Tax=Actinoplanes sp. M2I2 TaxID=1734444 RepID=UPI00201FBA80|nr:hypothetical protein [Actinoplanes sp. M2I2]
MPSKIWPGGGVPSSGAQPDGDELFLSNGRAVRLPPWAIDRVVRPLVVRRGLYRGVRDGNRHP